MRTFPDHRHAIETARRRSINNVLYMSELSELVIGLTVVAMGTSAPELIVSVDAALAGLGNIAVANVAGRTSTISHSSLVSLR